MTASADVRDRSGLRNWAGNVTFRAREVARPSSVVQLQELVAAAREVRALGTGHSFSPLADTHDLLVSVAGLPQHVVVDAATGTADVPAGMRLGDLAPVLDAAGLALPALPSLPHISVAGAVATATHGSGDGVPCLADAVTAVELVGPGGELRRYDAAHESFGGVVVSLGALGVVTRLRLRLVPARPVRQHVYDRLPLQALLDDLDGVLGAATSTSVFTRWREPVLDQVWRKDVLDPDSLAGPWHPERRWRGAVLADGPRHPVPGADPAACTTQGGVPGRWYDRLPHFRLDHRPSAGAELQSEWLVPRRRGADALEEVARLAPRIAPVLHVSEVRTVAADGQWLSPSGGRDVVALHFTWVADAAAVTPVVEALDAVLHPFGGRPHWGKLTTATAADLRPLYPRWDDAHRLLDTADPHGVFRGSAVGAVLPVRAA